MQLALVNGRHEILLLVACWKPLCGYSGMYQGHLGSIRSICAGAVRYYHFITTYGMTFAFMPVYFGLCPWVV